MLFDPDSDGENFRTLPLNEFAWRLNAARGVLASLGFIIFSFFQKLIDFKIVLGRKGRHVSGFRSVEHCMSFFVTDFMV